MDIETGWMYVSHVLQSTIGTADTRRTTKSRNWAQSHMCNEKRAVNDVFESINEGGTLFKGSAA